MTEVYKFDINKMLEPIKKSVWFYLFIFLTLMTNWILAGITGVLIVISIFGILILFHIILHIQYYLHDRNASIIIDSESRIITFNKKNTKTEFSFDDIRLVLHFKGSRYQSPLSYYIMPSNFYNWIKIEMKNGDNVSFSNFIKPDVNIYGIQKQERVIPFLNIIN
jgi:hypothetical protein